VRTNLTVEDLGGFLDQPLVAVIATLRTDGSVMLSPVWYEWRDGGFNVWVEAQNVKVRHLKRDPRSTIVVAESAPPLRGVEVRGIAHIIEDGVTETARRIAARYLAQTKLQPTPTRCAARTSSSESNRAMSGSGTMQMNSIRTEQSQEPSE
jgi:PPOX class probable F420-dependent enzyme